MNRAEEHPEEGLQVAPQQPGLETITDPNAEKVALPGRSNTSTLEPVKSSTNPTNDKSFPFFSTHTGNQSVRPETGQVNGAVALSEGDGLKSRQICGLRRRTFLIVMAVVFVIIVAIAVGAGVGATRSSGSSNGSSPQASSGSSGQAAGALSSAASSGQSNAPTPTTSDFGITRTTILDSPTETLVRDCPSSDGKNYAIEVGDNTLNYHKICNADIGFDAFKPITVGKMVTSSLNDCIRLCANPPLNDGGTGRVSCNAVCWRNRAFGGTPVGWCFGFEATDATVANNYTANTDANYCDSAVFTGNGTTENGD